MYLVLRRLFKHLQRYIIPAQAINAQRRGKSTDAATADHNFQNHFKNVSNTSTKG
jgi:hypothetical protein